MNLSKYHTTGWLDAQTKTVFLSYILCSLTFVSPASSVLPVSQRCLDTREDSRCHCALRYSGKEPSYSHTL